MPGGAGNGKIPGRDQDMGTASLRHPVTGAVYTDASGNVRVEHDGRVGLFRKDGAWIEGDLREADPMMCIWIAGHNYEGDVPFGNHRLQVNSGMGAKPGQTKKG
jgi:hypothetical protein